MVCVLGWGGHTGDGIDGMVCVRGECRAWILGTWAEERGCCWPGWNKGIHEWGLRETDTWGATDGQVWEVQKAHQIQMDSIHESIKSHNNPVKLFQLKPPFYIWEKWGWKRLNNLPKILQQVSHRDGFKFGGLASEPMSLKTPLGMDEQSRPFPQRTDIAGGVLWQQETTF